MTITVNGQAKDLAADLTLKDLVGQISRKPELVIAELNGAIIDRPVWDTTPLSSGDKVELVAFVGGG
jgi:sulfur carrier protein